MNMSDYRRGMDRLEPGAEVKVNVLRVRRRGTRRFRRVLTGVWAAAFAAVSLFTAALAASPELRAAVLSFFVMEEREQAPDGNRQSGVEISQTEIGQLVKAQYIRLDGYRYGFSGGLLNELTWSDDDRTLLAAKFWEIQEDTLVPVDIRLENVTVEVTFQGKHCRGELYWFIWNGELAVLKGDPLGIDIRPEDEWYVEEIPGRTDVIWLRLYEGGQMEYSEYPLLYHLDTGEVEDILSGTGAAALKHAYSYTWSEDMRRAIILCEERPDKIQTWVCDLEAGSTERLKDLTGLDGEIVASFADDRTLILYAYTKDAEQLYQDVTCYAFDIPSGRLAKTLDKAPYYRWFDEHPQGAMTYGSGCVLIGPDGKIQVVDLKSGERTEVEGFTFQKGDDFMPSPSGTKLLYYAPDPEADGLGIARLGVLDLEKNTFIAFDRDGWEDLYGEGIGWQDDCHVGVNVRTGDGGTRYLILYQF